MASKAANWQRTKKTIKFAKKRYANHLKRRDKKIKRRAANPKSTAPFMVRHNYTAKSVDWFTELAWRHFDKKDIKAGKITQEEWESFERDPAAIEQWRKQVGKRRSEDRARQRDSRPPGQWSSVAQVVKISGSVRDEVEVAPQPVSFTPPKPRKASGRPAPRPTPVYRAPRKRTRPPTRHIDRATQLRGVWADQWKTQKEIAVADVSVQAAITCLQALADQQPTDRAELHAQLAAFAAVGDAVGAASEKIKATLEQPQRDGSPGVPSEVTTHLSPIADAGATIADACQDTANAFEDRFAMAIQVAQDEEKMSDVFLKKQPA